MTMPPVAAPRERAVEDPLLEYLLRIADDRLVLGHRLSEWCGHAPILEEDIALANIALDLIGQASAFLSLAGEVEGKGRDENALAFFRDERGYRNALLVEQPNGDFGVTMMRQFLFDAFSVLHLEALGECGQPEVAARAAKALKEDLYHLRHSSHWVLRLGDGTEESHRRVQAALDGLWRFTGELFETDAVDDAVRALGIAPDMEAIRCEWRDRVEEVVARATLVLPEDVHSMTGGRAGRHSEHLGHLLAEMQSVARADPGATW